MSDPFRSLLSALDITKSARTSEDIFVGSSEWTPLGRVFGGQVLAQSLVAASRTVDDDRAAHSMHGYFLRPGDANQPITFSVDRIHDGRSFTTRRTQAYQNGQPILSMIASFQIEDPGLDHQAEMPEGVPEPESLPTAADLIGHFDHPVARNWASERPFDIRHVSSPVYLAADENRVAHQAVWIKCINRLPDDPVLHRAALAYASDYTLLESIYRRHGLSWLTPGLKAASLDHAMWWHRPGRADEWILYTQESPSASGGRGLALGRMFSKDGVLLASVAQEGMVRIPALR
ncbi:acyl-CoA thioesterase [Subtercola boreus]|uniref:Acyl-CoA thioesterase 2 n=1 Tax=Subtercola boreus TaxID=120213 RepID=A0A3E0WCL4_9MICO|nr:acyl-CoA thioesterase II [Subtercola boreus]RFA22104.1 acyl-CoA thioesterase II [Subtercola boreus]RFA22284.1 acyl-CoA thioesterase II [Subtercola boreus]RFA28147.1 acyl-CoA thioesterase II [Subtercola boreus]